MTMNDGVMMISRHRQWRAWQFGRRRSGLFSGGGSAGGDDGSGLNFNGFRKLPWWGKVVFVVLALGLGWLCYLRLFLFALFAWFSPVLLADEVLNILLPDGEEVSSQQMTERKFLAVVWGILTVLSVITLISPIKGLAVFFLLCLLLFLLWIFG